MFGIFSGARVSITFQIGSDFAECAAVESAGTGDTIHFLKRLEILPKQHTLAETVTALAEALLQDPKVRSGTLKVAPALVRVILVSPLSRRAEVVSTAELSAPARVTEALLRRVVSEGNVVRDTLSTMPAEYAVYERHVGEVRLNGYTTRAPLGKSAEEITVAVSHALTSPEEWRATAAVLESYFNRELTVLHRETPLADVADTLAVDAIFTGARDMHHLDGILR